MYPRLAIALLVGSFQILSAAAADHQVDVSKEAIPAEVSREIAAQLSPSGFKVTRGPSRTICEIWLCKEWTVSAEFKATAEVLYPFKPGQLIGVIRYPRKASDFRDQEIGAGVYTMRYAQQPVNGSHIGTSPTRDFVLLLAADADTKAANLSGEDLIAKSIDAAGTAHPAMLCLQQVEGQAADGLAIRHNEEHDWWIITVQSDAKAGDKARKLPIDLVVVGISSEV